MPTPRSPRPTASPAPNAAARRPRASVGSSCAPSRQGTVGIRAGIPIVNGELGYQFEYSDWWAIDTSVNDPREVDLIYQGTSGDGLLIVAAVPSSEAGVQAYTAQWTNLLKDWASDLQADDSEKNAILGPSIGFVDGTGLTFAGSRSNPLSADDAGRGQPPRRERRPDDGRGDPDRLQSRQAGRVQVAPVQHPEPRGADPQDVPLDTAAMSGRRQARAVAAPRRGGAHPRSDTHGRDTRSHAAPAPG